MSKMNNDDALGAALAKIFPRLRDVSIRDGVQSWDGNRWKISDILVIVRGLDELAKTVQTVLNVNMPPFEVSGGGQVLQPAKFLKENPLDNLRKMRDAAPNMVLQCLYRGRQAYGFEPISNAIQEEAIHAFIRGGVKVFRIFDMMNDIENVKTSINTLKKYQKENPKHGIIIEGAISYISEPSAPRAWELSDYADYAVQLAALDCNEIAIKDYAGVADDEVLDLILAIRGKLDAAGYAEKNINLHSHGEKPTILASTLIAGADKVDVAIGELSGGPSHTNMRGLIYKLLDGQFPQTEIDAHPVMQKLAEVEKAISKIVHDKDKTHAPGKSFDDLRAPLKKINSGLIQKYRVAAGALSDLTGRVQRQYPNDAVKAEALFREVLDETPALWEKAGRFNTVTPGSKIIIDQAVTIAQKKKYNQPFTMADYTPEYLSVVISRYGKNMCMEKGVLGTEFRDAALMYRALKAINAAIENDDILNIGPTGDLNLLLMRARLGSDGKRLRMNEKSGYRLIDLNDPALEAVLLTQHDRPQDAPPIERLKAAIHQSNINQDIKDQILAELTPGRSADPTAGMNEGQEIVNSEIAKFPELKLDAEEAKELTLLAILLRSRGPQGEPDDSILRGLCAAAENASRTAKAA